MRSQHQRETEFLRQCLLYADTAEHHELDQRLRQLERNERCVQRAVWLMAALTAVAIAGLCYAAVFMADYQRDMPQFVTQFVTRIFCTLGLASVICMLAFVGLGAVYRNELDKHREECRRLAPKLLESRLGKPCPMPLPDVVKEQ